MKRVLFCLKEGRGVCGGNREDGDLGGRYHRRIACLQRQGKVVQWGGGGAVGRTGKGRGPVVCSAGGTRIWLWAAYVTGAAPAPLARRTAFAIPALLLARGRGTLTRTSRSNTSSGWCSFLPAGLGALVLTALPTRFPLCRSAHVYHMLIICFLDLLVVHSRPTRRSASCCC